METITVIYRQDEDTWVAQSPEISNWTVVADTYDEARQLADEGVPFALERTDINVEHYVSAPLRADSAASLKASRPMLRP
jgi:predicted RNase H-like HicB family nuclease